MANLATCIAPKDLPPAYDQNGLNQKNLRAAFTRFIKAPSLKTLRRIAFYTTQQRFVLEKGVKYKVPCVVGQHILEKNLYKSCDECPLSSFNGENEGRSLCADLVSGDSDLWKLEVRWAVHAGEVLRAIIQFSAGFQ